MAYARRPLSLLPLCFVACTSIKNDVQTMCDVDRASLVDKRPELTTDEAKLDFFFDWAAHNIWTEEGRGLLSELRKPELAWPAKADLLRDAAARTGASKCGLPRWIDAHTKASGK